MGSIVRTIISISVLPEQVPTPCPVRVRVTVPDTISLGPGVYTAFNKPGLLKVPSPEVVQVVILQNCAVPAMVNVLAAQIVASAPALTMGKGDMIRVQVDVAVVAEQVNEPDTVRVSVTVPVSPKTGM